ncbi:response regulator [Thiocystis violascens]|uniref:histidine kinase n=1 Tax=Thiocystis violascens (strain ATCC 17096 / DSM 198 / 6111) TaxID=765911 RepID=I3Y6Z2_THIV6|nr:response regulator [Thiocystis violascens]AFL72760.1 PAS domain S-box/diguanylate cyclase (GGDEF) domain-containing protein [Thiocystis violascens DSM 198]
MTDEDDRPEAAECRPTDRALRDREPLFQAMFMNAPLCILIHDADTGEMLEANPTACAQYGYASFESLKAGFGQIWLEPPYSIEDSVQWATKTILEGPQQFEWCYRHAEGKLQWEWVHLSTLVLHGKLCILAMTVDITHKKQIAADLQASQAYASAIIDAAPVPIAVIDEGQRINYLNPAFIEMFGYTLEDVPTLADWWPRAYPDPDYRQWVQGILQERLAHVEQAGGRFEPLDELLAVDVRCKDGRVRTVQGGATHLGPAFGGLYLFNFYDVTDLKQAREQAEQSARVKSEFLTNMSHEIRTPLNAMLGLAQLLEGEALSAEQCHLVQRLREAGQSLLALVNDILDLSKLAAGQLRLTARTFSPAAVLAQVASLLGQEARAKGLAFRIDAPANLAAWLRGDSLRLEQILVNLVGNAVKFTDHGEVRIQVSQADIDTQRVRLRLEIQDTGIGITPEHLPTLGAAFTQADGSITRRFGGTGLGLAISKQLVERMEGTFGIDSTLGVGSAFWCELPFARASADDAIPLEKAAPAERTLGPRLSGVHCLVADDCPLNQELVERALRCEGARVTLVADGRQALDWLRDHPKAIDAVLMDIQMPVMDGLTAARAIREELGLIELPVIACSAGVLAEHRQQAHEAGFSDFLAKPMDLEDLVAVLQRWCATPAADAAPPTGVPTRTLSGAPRTVFPDIPGLDTHQAARLLGDDWSLFIKLLPKLTMDFRDAAQRTRDDLARGAMADAALGLHSLQGRLGYLGARELIQTARTLEQGLLDGRTDLEDMIDTLEGQLAALLSALAPWLEQSTQPAASAGAANALDSTQLAALHAALIRGDLAALALFEVLEPALVRRDGEAATAALAETIRLLRFDEALALLAPEPDPSLDAADRSQRRSSCQTGLKKILIVDDDPVSVQLAGAALMSDYQCEFALSGARALERLNIGAPPALILLDLMMPEMDGYALCRWLRGDPRWRDLPVIYVTASQDLESETRALRTGATDFISKPINPPVLRLRVGLQIELRKREQALRESEARFERLAHYDALTGLPNRLLLADRLHQAMVQTLRRGQSLALAYLDLDGFKAINDRHGHAAGDQLLKVVSERMQQAVREGDTLARLGGDEFVAVLVDLADSDASVPLLKRLLAAAAAPVPLGELVVQVSASIGVTFYPQPDEIDADQLLRQADRAMYQAKLTGKNRYQVFDREDDRRPWPS